MEKNPMRSNGEYLAPALVLLGGTAAYAEIVEYEGSPDALPHDAYVHVVDESRSPIDRVYIESADGAYVAAAIRKPVGDGPFPAIVMFHGAPGGRGMEQLVGWSRGDHGGPAWERFLQQGFVVVVADYRGGPFNVMNQPSDSGLTTAIDDGIAIVAHVASLPYVDAERVSVYGASLGGNLALFLAAKIPTLRAVVAGAPAPFWFLGARVPERPGAAREIPFEADDAIAAANIEPIRTPILIQAGTNDPLLEIDRVLHEQLSAHGKAVRMEIYEHGYHDFVLGPQGHDRPDLPQGEILLQATLDALERSLRFVETGRF
jgi:dipeptidyl aminopeptidase/acylaminoacyl peptidase